MTQSQLSAGLTTGKEGEGGEAAQRTDVSAALQAGWKLGNRRCEEQRGLTQGIHLYSIEQKQLL